MKYLFFTLTLLFTAPLSAQWIEYVEDPSRLVTSNPDLSGPNQQEMDLAVADVDKDGDMDLVVVRKVPFSFPGGDQDVLLINEGGTLVDRTTEFCNDFKTNISDARDVVLVDVDGDTWLDIVVVNTFNEDPQLYMNLGLDGGKTWAGFRISTDRFPTLIDGSIGPKFCGVAAGDLTGNGALDLYFVDYANTLEDILLINDGSGFFTNETDTRMAPGFADSGFGTSTAIMDFNRDGWLDIAKVHTSEGGTLDDLFVIMYNDGTGRFTQSQNMDSNQPYMFVSLDYDHDGDLDFYIVDDQQDRLLTQNGVMPDGSLATRTQILQDSPRTSNFGGNVTIGDLDGDGWEDLLVSDVDVDVPGCDRRSAFLRNQGRGAAIQFADPYPDNRDPAWVTTGTFDTALFDIDGDQVLDLVLGTCDGMRIFMGCYNVRPAATQVQVCIGGSAEVRVDPVGKGPFTYQWYKDGEILAGSTLAAHQIVNATAADTGTYTCEVAGDCGEAFSAGIAVSLHEDTQITANPQNQTICPGTEMSLSVTAQGGDLTYQWRRNGQDLEGETAATMTIAAVSVADAGTYDCVVTGCSQITSNSAELVVDGPLEADIYPPLSAQGLESVELSAVVACALPAANLQWRNLNSGEVFGQGQSTVTLTGLTQTTVFELTVTDDQSASETVIAQAVVLVPENDQYTDPNGDKCNNIFDLWYTASGWPIEAPFQADANGDDQFNLLDLLYVNTEDEGVCDPPPVR